VSLLDAYAPDLETAARNTVSRPPQPKAPSFSVWGTVAGVPRGAAAGVSEVAGSGMDLSGAFGDVLATTEASAGGMFALQSEQERRESQKAVEKLRTEGLDFRNEIGAGYRAAARAVMPDPTTAHGAEVAVAEFARIATKAVGAGIALGPVGGAALSGAEEGFTAADKLAEQGVDPATRTGVGAVTAAVQAATFGLPVAGQTVRGTVGLALAGGPVGFIAQQAAVREILDRADYSKLADQYDPFDPVGLTLSTVLPLGFGAMAMRAGRRAAAADAAAAEAAMIASPNPPSARTQVASAVDEALVDAARVVLMRQQSEAARLTPAEDLAGAARHEQALATAVEQMGAGSRVDVADALDLPPAAVARVVDDAAERLRPVTDELEPWLAEAAPRPVIDDGIRRTARLTDARLDDPEIRQQLEWMIAQPGWAQRGGELLRGNPDEPGTGGMGGVIGRTQWIAASDWYRELQSDAATKLPDGKDGVETAIRKALDGEPMKPQERRAVRFMLEVAREDADPLSPTNLKREMERAALDPTPDNAIDSALVARAAEIDDAAVERLAIQFENDDAAFLAGIERIIDDFESTATAARGAADQPAAQGGKAAGPDAAGPAADGRGGAEGGRLPVESPELDRAAAELERLNPDLPVRLDGMEAAVPLRELMARLREEVAAEVAEIPLLEVAAQCALRAAGPAP
jgi:hypothetical protein